ncbi:hypothetical protein [Sphingomonas sp.]|uniref:hypothetical protein n=1 Tax=Sphingomonas sp. TaxID=28214 RepID=UPI003D6D64CE
MTTTIIAKAASFTDDGYITLLGFADDPSTPVNYVMLNMTNEPDEQDLGLDQGGIHIDAGALQVDGYDLVQDIRETDAGVVVSLTADAAQKGGIDQEIEIELASKVIDGTPVGEAVQRFKNRLSSWEQAKAR